MCLARYTKMGYAGNWEPSHIIPTAVALSTQKVSCIRRLCAEGLECIGAATVRSDPLHVRPPEHTLEGSRTSTTTSETRSPSLPFASHRALRALSPGQLTAHVALSKRPVLLL